MPTDRTERRKQTIQRQREELIQRQSEELIEKNEQIRKEYERRHSIEFPAKPDEVKSTSNSSLLSALQALNPLSSCSNMSKFIEESNRLVILIENASNEDSKYKSMEADAKVFQDFESCLKRVKDASIKTNLLKIAVSPQLNIGMVRLLIKHGAIPDDSIRETVNNMFQVDKKNWLLANLPASTGGKSRSNRNLKKSRNSVKHKVSRKRKYKVRRTRSKSH